MYCCVKSSHYFPKLDFSPRNSQYKYNVKIVLFCCILLFSSNELTTFNMFDNKQSLEHVCFILKKAGLNKLKPKWDTLVHKNKPPNVLGGSEFMDKHRRTGIFPSFPSILLCSEEIFYNVDVRNKVALDSCSLTPYLRRTSFLI